MHIDLKKAAEGGRSAVSSALVTSVDPSRHAILVIDDEPAILRAIQRTLGAYHVTVTESGLEGVALGQARRFDLVICDQHLPDLCGLDVFAKLKLRRPDLGSRFLLMTGGGTSAQSHRQLLQWELPVLSKPFRPTELRRRVSTHLLAAGEHGVDDPAGRQELSPR